MLPGGGNEATRPAPNDLKMQKLRYYANFMRCFEVSMELRKILIPALPHAPEPKPQNSFWSRQSKNKSGWWMAYKKNIYSCQLARTFPSFACFGLHPLRISGQISLICFPLTAHRKKLSTGNVTHRCCVVQWLISMRELWRIWFEYNAQNLWDLSNRETTEQFQSHTLRSVLNEFPKTTLCQKCKIMHYHEDRPVFHSDSTRACLQPKKTKRRGWDGPSGVAVDLQQEVHRWGGGVKPYKRGGFLVKDGSFFWKRRIF